jgi:hypothetical protein
MALIPIVLVIIDLCVIVIGVQMNDATCRDAARIAATGNPLDAQIRAQSVVNQTNDRVVGLPSSFTLVSVVSSVTPNDITALGALGGPLRGTVTVETEVSIHPMVVQWVYSGKNPLLFRAQQSFPFTYVVPSSVPSSFHCGTTPTTIVSTLHRADQASTIRIYNLT